jgi:hypothetical protein
MVKYLVIQTKTPGPQLITMEWQNMAGVWKYAFPGGTEIIGVLIK